MNYIIDAPIRSKKTSFNTKGTTKVILVRHGRTTYNQQGRYQGSSNASVLTERGHLDARATGVALRQFDFDVIYTSPLTRVRQTTEEIVSAITENSLDLPPIFVEPKLTEVCMSDWQGLAYQEVKERYVDAYHCWQNTPHLFTRDCLNYPVLDLFAKAQLFWQEILDKHRGKTILIVAHGGTNRALISTAIGLEAKQYHTLQQSNCGISCLQFSSDRISNAELLFLNFTSHLQEKLPKLKAGKTGWRWLLLSNQLSLNNFNRDRLLELNRNNTIDCIFSDLDPFSESLSNFIVKESKPIINFSVDKNNFLSHWQKTIAKRQQQKDNCDRERLFTGLIIASEHLLIDIIAQTINSNSSLDLTDNLVAIHYPAQEYRSILQGIIPLRPNLVSMSAVEN